MHSYSLVRRGLLASACALSVACSDFLAVDNPNVIDVGAIDPVADAGTLANSAQQNFAAALGWSIMYQAWFTGEAQVSETFPTRNEFGRRDVQQSNGNLNVDVWATLATAAASSNLVLKLALPNPTTNLNFTRTALWRGFSFVLMAETFCTGTVESGPELSTAIMLDSAVANFTQAITIGRAINTAEATALANTALVGRARAHLQAGRKTQAAADAAAVPAAFAFTLGYIDDLANRNRLGNRMWQFTLDRGSISVAPDFRVTDSRVRFKAPNQHNLTPQDPSAGAFFIQDKYPAFTTPIRVASKLEADYIGAEAGTTADQLALIAARRAAAGQPAYSGATTASAVLTELLWQKSLDFWLEGKRLGDSRRNPNNMTALPAPGSAYFKAGFAPVGSVTCYPLPLQERDNNPNLRGG